MEELLKKMNVVLSKFWKEKNMFLIKKNKKFGSRTLKNKRKILILILSEQNIPGCTHLNIAVAV